jgi:hypothetical protein
MRHVLQTHDATLYAMLQKFNLILLLQHNASNILCDNFSRGHLEQFCQMFAMLDAILQHIPTPLDGKKTNNLMLQWSSNCLTDSLQFRL